MTSICKASYSESSACISISFLVSSMMPYAFLCVSVDGVMSEPLSSAVVVPLDADSSVSECLMTCVAGDNTSSAMLSLSLSAYISILYMFILIFRF